MVTRRSAGVTLALACLCSASMAQAATRQMERSVSITRQQLQTAVSSRFPLARSWQDLVVLQLDRAQVQWQPQVHYGDPLPQPAVNVSGDGIQPVLLISLAATPEAEIHGPLLADARNRWGSGTPIWLWSHDFAERNHATPRRLQERENLWQDFVRPYGLAVTILPESAT